MEKLSLSLVETDLFHNCDDIHPSRWLFETLAKGRKKASQDLEKAIA